MPSHKACQWPMTLLDFWGVYIVTLITAPYLFRQHLSSPTPCEKSPDKPAEKSFFFSFSSVLFFVFVPSFYPFSFSSAVAILRPAISRRATGGGPRPTPVAASASTATAGRGDLPHNPLRLFCAVGTFHLDTNQWVHLKWMCFIGTPRANFFSCRMG